MVMEVHTSDPLQPPSPITLPMISLLSPTVPEDILRPRGRRGSATFPFHAIVYLDTLYDAEVRASWLLLCGGDECLEGVGAKKDTLMMLRCVVLVALVWGN